MKTSPPQFDVIACELRSLSWMLVVTGFVSIAIGVLAFIAPLASLAALVLLFGAYAIADGVVALVAAVRARRTHANAWHQLVRGAISVLAGLLTFAFPPITWVVLLMILAIWIIMIGLLELVAAMRMRRPTGRASLFAVSGIISILFGAVILISPAGPFAAAAVIGVCALVRGSLTTWAGLRFHGARAIRLAARRSQLRDSSPAEATWRDRVTTVRALARVLPIAVGALLGIPALVAGITIWWIASSR